MPGQMEAGRSPGGQSVALPEGCTHHHCAVVSMWWWYCWMGCTVLLWIALRMKHDAAQAKSRGGAFYQIPDLPSHSLHSGTMT